MIFNRQVQCEELRVRRGASRAAVSSAAACGPRAFELRGHRAPLAFQNRDRKHRTYVYVLIVTEVLEDWEDSVNIGKPFLPPLSPCPHTRRGDRAAVRGCLQSVALDQRIRRETFPVSFQLTLLHSVIIPAALVRVVMTES